MKLDFESSEEHRNQEKNMVSAVWCEKSKEISPENLGARK